MKMATCYLRNPNKVAVATASVTTDTLSSNNKVSIGLIHLGTSITITITISRLFAVNREAVLPLC